MPAPMNQGANAYFVQKDLSHIFGTSYSEGESMLPALFDMREPDQAIVNEVLDGEPGAIQEFDGAVRYDEVKQSYRKQTEEVEYAGGVAVTKKFRRNDLYGVVRRRVSKLARRFRAKREAIGADIFNGAFTTTLTADGLSLCHTAHTSDVGGPNQGNSGTSAFSPANVEATRRLVIAFLDNRGEFYDEDPDLLLLPLALEEQGYELIKSKGKVDTAMNNANFHEGKYKMAVWRNWLTDSNNWFFCVSRVMKELLAFYEWNPTEFFYAGEMDSLVTKHVGYMSVNASAADWRFLYGHNVS